MLRKPLLVLDLWQSGREIRKGRQPLALAAVGWNLGSPLCRGAIGEQPRWTTTSVGAVDSAMLPTSAPVEAQAVWLGITLEGWLTLLAVVLGPILAVQAQKYMETIREAQGRKLRVFQELMATRMARLSPRHVEALNLIDLEYSRKRKRDLPVLEAWKAYHDSLFNAPADPELQPAFFQRRNELLIDLLHRMGQRLGFDFDRTDINRGSYSPVAHGDLENDQQLIRKGIVELLTGKRGISTLTWVMGGQTPVQVEVLEAPPTSTAQATPPEQKQPLTSDSPEG